MQKEKDRHCLSFTSGGEVMKNDEWTLGKYFYPEDYGYRVVQLIHGISFSPVYGYD